MTCTMSEFLIMRNMRISVIDEEGKNAGETVDELRNIIEGMMDQKMIQMFID